MAGFNVAGALNRARACNDESSELHRAQSIQSLRVRSRSHSRTRADNGILLDILRGAIVAQCKQVGRREAVRELRVRVLEARGERRRQQSLFARGAAGLSRLGRITTRDLVAQA